MLSSKSLIIQSMKIPVFKRTLQIHKYFSLVIFFVALFTACYLMSIGWNSSLIGPHDFRQTQTAISVFYLLKGGPWINYITPVLGPDWSIPYEFPLVSMDRSRVGLDDTYANRSSRAVGKRKLFLVIAAALCFHFKKFKIDQR